MSFVHFELLITFRCMTIDTFCATAVCDIVILSMCHIGCLCQRG